jgi:hypothetical protein
MANSSGAISFLISFVCNKFIFGGRVVGKMTRALNALSQEQNNPTIVLPKE